MHPRLRFWLIVALGATAGVVVSFGLAQETYALAGLLALLIGWLLLEWAGGPRPEAWALAAALFGYLLGNRGFAQFLLTPNLPLLPAEAALLLGAVAVTLRMAFRQTAALQRDGLNLALLLWILLGTGRLAADLRPHGVLALRDFATVYYALFFFIAQSLASHPPSARLLRRAVLAACLILPPLFFLYGQFPDFFHQSLRFRGVPLIYFKDDLVAAYFFAGFFLIVAAVRWPPLLRGTLALAAFASAFTINSSRAAIVGLLVTSAWWAAARRWAPLKLQAFAAPVALTALALVALFQEKAFTESRLFSLYEHAASMVDFTGTGRYSSTDRHYVGDNNRFRLAWWRAVAEETRERGPLFGLGFGADLTTRFLRTYELDLGDEFTTRSPHSIILTVLGRLGLAGLIALLAILGAMALRTLRLVRLARTDDTALAALGWWSVAWVMFVSACFGVVLEGPMGAILFWSALGLANQATTELEPAPSAAAPTPGLETNPAPASGALTP